MPVSRNQESGVLSRQTSICSSGIPIKKRRFPFVPLSSPPREGEPAPSEVNNKENRQESAGIDLSVVDNTSKADVIKDSLNEVKKEIAADVNASSIQTDICTKPRALASCPPMQLDVKEEVTSVVRVNSVQNNADLGKSAEEDISPAMISVSGDKVNSNFSSLGNIISAGHTANSNLSFPSVNVKKEMVNVRLEGENKHELPTALGNVKLSLTSNELFNSPLEKEKVDLSSQVTDKLDPSLLSLSYGKEELPENMGADVTVTDSNVIMSSSDRLNWDLNTTMDAWAGSIDDAASHDTIGADKFSSSLGTHDVKNFLGSTSLVNVKVDKGKQVMEPFEERSTLGISSMSCQQFNAEDSLCLSLSTSSPHDFGWVMPHLILQRPIINSITSGSKIVKSEPVDENVTPDLLSVPCGTMGSLDNRLVNKKITECCEASKTFVDNFRNLIEPTSFKAKVGQESNQETHCAADFTLKRPNGNIGHHHESCSSTSTVATGSITPQLPLVSKLTTCPELSVCKDLSDRSEHYSITTRINVKDIVNPSIASLMPEPVNNYSEDPNVCDDGKVNSSETMTFSLQLSDKVNIDPNTITEESASDKEKISAMVEGDTYVSDYESDDNHDVVSQMGRDDGQCEKVDDDYEDGEVRELSGKSFMGDPTSERMLSENIKEVDDGCEMRVPADKSTTNEKHSDIEFLDESNDHNELIEAMNDGNGNQLVSDYVSLPVTLSEHVISVQTEAKVPEKSLVNLSVQDEVPDTKETELMGDEETKDMVQATASEARNENVKVSDETGMTDNGSNADGVPDLSLSKAEVNDHSSLKDSALGGSRSRIITLPRASDSPSRIRSLSGRSFTSWTGRERYGDVDGDNLHYRGHRDDTYGGDSRNFTRDRSFRNSRMDFKRDRGRDTDRLDSLQNKWDIEHFPSKSFDVSDDYRFNRYKRSSAVADHGFRSNDFVVAQDETGPSVGRLGRKPSIEEFHSFRQPPSSRRLSPGSRDGATIRSLPNLRRIPESDSDLPGLGNKKFFRGLPDDISGSAFTRPEASYDEMGSQFVPRNQNYSTVQRRVFPRARSKSPGNTRTRSPGTWTSSRRRFNDDFNNSSDQNQHRPMYRVQRMRSPDRVCYTDELCDRRRASPNYVTRGNEMRDMDFSRGNGHARSISSNRRSPSDRTFPRSTRRLDVVDSRERTDSDEYFSGPVHSDRFHEFRGDGSNERRKFGERRDLFRPSRPPPRGGGNENYHFNVENGSRPLRFCSNQDTEGFERSNVRQRDFDGGTKACLSIAQRQIRSTEDQEGSFGQTEEVWHNESFSDDSRMKRRRF